MSDDNDLFLDLRDTLEQDLRATGFSPSKEPPDKEPTIPKGLSEKPNEFLKSLYDEFLAYYVYLTDQVAQDTYYAAVGKARLELKIAEATKRISTDVKLTNAEHRKSAIVTDHEVLGAQRDFTYFKSKLSVQEDRKRKISKCMDRIGRELWFRTQTEHEPQVDFFKPITKAPESPHFPGAFKRTTRDD